MKLHIRLFLISIFLIVLAIVGIQMINYAPSEAMVAQAEATAYFITFAGVILVFRWFKQKATPVGEGEQVPVSNVAAQKKVLYTLLGINVLNAVILMVSQKQSVQMMVGISLIVILISPHLFRTMQEKDGVVETSSEEKDE